MHHLQAQRRGFTPGGGTFTCRICKRLTRPTGTGDNDHVGLCVICYDLEGAENSRSDRGAVDEPYLVLGHLVELTLRGVDVSRWADLEKVAVKQIKDKA